MDLLKGPDFIIVGAMRSGTTAMTTYLGEHPEILITRHKEPGYFATDFPMIRYVTKESDYRKLFRTKKKSARIAGEGSVWYLYSEEALENIHRFNPTIKIIIMLRNPMQAIVSQYEHNKLFFAENTDTLEEALRLQEERLAGRSMPKKQSLHPRMYQYEQIAKLGWQVQRAMQIFPRKQIKIILFEDFVSHTKAVYEDLLAFLGVASDNRIVFPKMNPRRMYRYPRLTWPLFKMLNILSKIRVKMGILTNTRILALLDSILTRPVPKTRNNMSPTSCRELIETFRDDLNLLSELLHRDVRGWLHESNGQYPSQRD